MSDAYEDASITGEAAGLYESGIRKEVDEVLAKKAESVYPSYWRGSSAGYCMRKVIFDRLGVTPVRDDPRKYRVFESGHIFHEWFQRVTRETKLSVAQEEELVDDEILVVGHFDDLIYKNGKYIMYDYKTQHSKAFWWAKKSGTSHKMSYTHRMQLGTYMYIKRKTLPELEEGRILKISKDDLSLLEQQLFYSPKLEKDIIDYWTTLQAFWEAKKIPPCTCHEHDGGFMAREQYNPYFYNGKPCSLDWYARWKKEQAAKS